jgi:hypothetical protein
MIFYTALDERGHRQLRGTQADAKAVNRVFEQIDIPTDKPGLMAFVQGLYEQIDNAYPAATPIEPALVEPPKPCPVQQSINFDEQFDELPLAHQLHFAAIAMENAREAL